jgi:hypothetical protein
LRFVLFVEGFTEKRALPAFLKRWLDPQLTEPVGVKVVRFEGWQDYLRDIAKKVRRHLTDNDGDEVIAAIGLIDLYGPTFYPSTQTTVAQRCDWASRHFANLVGDSRFHQHFAVHETEAWLLSDPAILPVQLPASCSQPEAVNFGQPPARLLNSLYRTQLKRPYKKLVDGYSLFAKLNPEEARKKCPHLDLMLVEMLTLARQAGL